MNIKMLSLFSLLLTINVMNGSNGGIHDWTVRAQYDKYHDQAVEDTITSNNAVEEGSEGVLQTDKGIIYILSSGRVRECLKDYDINSSDAVKNTLNKECEPYEKAEEKAFDDLKRTPEYAELRTLLKNKIYNDNVEAGLHGILHIDSACYLEGWTKEKRDEKLNNFINSNTQYADTTFYDVMWKEDTREDQQRAQDKLRSIVNEIEANNQ